MGKLYLYLYPGGDVRGSGEQVLRGAGLAVWRAVCRSSDVLVSHARLASTRILHHQHLRRHGNVHRSSRPSGFYEFDFKKKFTIFTEF